MWWPPNKSFAGFAHQALFLLLSTLATFNYVMATLTGPGLMPKQWHPKVTGEPEAHGTRNGGETFVVTRWPVNRLRLVRDTCYLFPLIVPTIWPEKLLTRHELPKYLVRVWFLRFFVHRHSTAEAIV